jgi:hypothetical protein
MSQPLVESLREALSQKRTLGTQKFNEYSR